MLFARRLLVFLSMALLLGPAASGQSVEYHESESLEASEPPKADPQPADASAVANLIVEKTNEFRDAEGRQQVEVDPQLAKAAEYFAKYMADNDAYGHTADGNRPSQRAEKFGYDYCLVSENIAYQYSSAGFATMDLAQRFVEGWKSSPGHRKNMLEPYVLETGVAAARSEKTGYWYAVQMFGRPASAAIEFKIANRANTAVEYKIGEQTFPLPPRYTRTHTRCRPSEVTFKLAAEGGGERIKPASGETFRIVEQDGRLSVAKQ